MTKKVSRELLLAQEALATNPDVSAITPEPGGREAAAASKAHGGGGGRKERQREERHTCVNVEEGVVISFGIEDGSLHTVESDANESLLEPSDFVM